MLNIAPIAFLLAFFAVANASIAAANQPSDEMVYRQFDSLDVCLKKRQHIKARKILDAIIKTTGCDQYEKCFYPQSIWRSIQHYQAVLDVRERKVGYAKFTGSVVHVVSGPTYFLVDVKNAKNETITFVVNHGTVQGEQYVAAGKRISIYYGGGDCGYPDLECAIKIKPQR